MFIIELRNFAIKSFR